MYNCICLFFRFTVFVCPQELCDLWRRQSREPLWQHLFQTFDLAAEVPRNEHPAMKPAEAAVPSAQGGNEPGCAADAVRPEGLPDSAPAAPEANQQGRKRPSMEDGITPEKTGAAAKRVKECQPVPFGQPQQAEAVLKGCKSKSF